MRWDEIIKHNTLVFLNKKKRRGILPASKMLSKPRPGQDKTRFVYTNSIDQSNNGHVLSGTALFLWDWSWINTERWTKTPVHMGLHSVLNLRGSKGERAPEALTCAPPAGSWVCVCVCVCVCEGLILCACVCFVQMCSKRGWTWSDASRLSDVW
jgi:hypothetical protein